MSFEATHPLHLMREAITPAADAIRRHQTPITHANHTRHQTPITQASSGVIRHHQTPSDANHTRQQTDAIRRHHLPLGRVIRRHQASSGVITFHSAASVSNRPTINPPPSGRMYLMKETSTRHQASPGVTRRHQAPSGDIRRHQRPSAHVHEDGSSTTGHSRPTAAIGSVSK